MEFVEPIRSKVKIREIREYLESKGLCRDLLFFSLGMNSALRGKDLLDVRVRDLFNDDGSIKDWFDTRESKTSKRSRVTITPKVRQAIEEYQQKHPAILKDPDHFIFFNTRTMPLGSKAIGRKHAWSIVNDFCHRVGLKGNYGTHTLRKTWGYQAKQKGVELYLIQKKLNHSNTGVTLRYLGITDDDLEAVANELDL